MSMIDEVSDIVTGLTKFIKVYIGLNDPSPQYILIGMIFWTLYLSARGKNKEWVHAYKEIKIYWLRKFRIRNNVKQ